MAVAIALLAAPSGASATEALVPPGNSAATQYTEAIPTGGGEKSTEGTGHKRPRSPQQTLGAKNTKRLESQGAVGRATAELATETAPSAGPPPAAQPRANASPHSGGKPAPGGAKRPGDGAGHAPPEPGASPTAKPPAATTSGSSGLGSVLAAATGTSSSGQIGALLPLALLATMLWAIYWLARQRRRLE